MMTPKSFTPFGLEIEGQIPKDLGSEGFRAELSRLVPVLSGKPRSPTQSYAKWRIEKEPTLSNTVDHEIVEIISPILKSSDDVEQAQILWSQLEGLGFEPLPLIGGVHIHLSWPQPTPLQLLSFRILVSCMAKEIFDFFQVSKARQRWVGRPEDLASLAQRAQTLYQKMQSEYEQNQELTEPTAKEWRSLQLQSADPFLETWNGKNSMVRWTSLKTVEVRGLNSTLDFQLILRTRNFFLELMKIAQTDLTFIFERCLPLFPSPGVSKLMESPLGARGLI